MGKKPDWSRFNLGTPAKYQITIRGYLDESWSNQLSGMAIQHVVTADKTHITILQGQLVDQAALFGVLNSLYGLGFPIIEVQCTPTENADLALVRDS